MRKLLPYEHALIENLGITEEEYFAFRKAQHEYADAKVGTVFDIRNGEPVSTIALIMTIVGTLAQVGAALLAPRPEAPEVTGGNRRARDRRFAPRIGFDSLQDLAEYGAPVNLVYGQRGSEKTSVNDALANPDGGVRVNTSLLWSAVYSFGNAQYIQMMAAVGAGEIVDIDYDRTAVGQTLVKLFKGGLNSKAGRAAVWQYFSNSGPIIKSDLKTAGGSDPLLLGAANSRTVYDPLIDSTTRSQGFSQAFSPSSSSSFGITSPIPIRMSVFARNEEGVSREASVKITATNRGDFWPGSYFGQSRKEAEIGDQIVIEIDKVNQKKNPREVDDFADEIRESSAESIELGAIYKLGSAKFQVEAIDGAPELDKGKIKVTLSCTEKGMGPFEDYNTVSVDDQAAEIEQQIKELEPLLDANSPTSYVYQRNALSEGDYFRAPDWTATQFTLLERTRVKRDQVEDLYDAIVSYKRSKRQMDELILEAGGEQPGRQFSQAVIDLANEVRRVETDLENDRDTKERISSNIERLGETPERLQRLKSTKETMETRKKELRKLRTNLASALREYALADGQVESQVKAARQLTSELSQEFKEKLSAKDYKAIFDQIDPLFDSFSGSDAKASTERKTMRKLKNIYAKIENLLLSLGQTDWDAYNAKRAELDALISRTNTELSALREQLAGKDRLNDYLGTKCLVKTEEAEYETLSPVNLVHFALKARVFMRVQGRAPKYGETDAKKYKDSDNGYKPRAAMFRVYYKKPNDERWESPSIVFCVRRAFDKDNFIPLIFRSPDSEGQAKWQFRFEPVFDAPSEAIKHGGSLDFVYLENRGTTKDIDGIFFYKGYRRSPDINNLPARNKSIYGVDEWTIFSQYADTSIQFSFDNGPEFAITAVSEQQFEDFLFYPLLYKDIATIGLNAYSGAGLTSMRNLSVFANKGKKVRLIELSPPSYPSSPNGPSCFASDIFLDTILDQDNGIRAFIDAVNEESIDIEKLALSKAFCMKQRYFMDGVIASQGSWRSFWSETAPYSLLELARIGGKETLIPAVPTLGDGTLTRNVTISALFNQGNILEGSYKEEFLDYGEGTQDLIATIIYRDQSKDEPFPRNNSVTIKLKNTEDSLASRQSFDLSNFVTNRNQAINYGMLLAQQRRHVRRAVEFKTFPTEAPVAPGSYIYVHMEENQWNDIHSGAVMDDGTLNIPFASEGINGTYDTLIYEPGKAPFKQSISYVNGQSSVLSTYKGKGVLFVLGSQISAKRVFRVTEVTMEEEGEVTIRAIEHPCAEEGGQTKSLVANFDATLFSIG